MKRGSIIILWGMLLCYSQLLVAQRITLSTKWTAQAQFAGYYIADKLGFYQEEGLDIKIIHPTLSENSSSFLKSGRADIVLINLSQTLVERANGAPLVNIMQTSQQSSLMIISRYNLDGMASLKNKKVAVWNLLNQELLDQVAVYYELEQIEWIRFNGGVDAFLSGAVDYCLVGSYNESLLLAEYGMKINREQVIRLAEYDYNLPEEGLYVTEEFYNKHPEVIPKIVKASIRGWKWAHEHPEEALDIVMEEIKLNNVGTNRYHQRKMLEEILRLQIPQDSNQQAYQLSKEGLERAVKVLIPNKAASIRYEEFVK